MGIAPDNNTITPIAYVYARLSTDEQKKGAGKQRQLDLAAKYAAKHTDLNLHLTHTYNDTPFEDLGFSAFTGEHLEKGIFGQFYKAAQRKDPDLRGCYLLIEHWDRISRMELHAALRVYLDLIEAGITIILTKRDVVLSNDASSQVKLVNVITTTLDSHTGNLESTTKVDRLLDANKRKRENLDEFPFTGRCPRWLRLEPKLTKEQKRSHTPSWFVPFDHPTPENQKPTPKELKEMLDASKRVAAVRYAFQRAANGKGNYTIMRELNGWRKGVFHPEKVVPPFGPRPTRYTKLGKERTLKPDRPHVWQQSAVERLVTNEAVLGHWQPHKMVDGEQKEGGPKKFNYFPRIIADALWNKVRAVRREREELRGKWGNPKAAKGKDIANLFSGMLTCGYCGGSMHYRDHGIRKDRKNKNPTKYLFCDVGQRGSGCKKISWPYADFETSFLSFVNHPKFDTKALFSNTEAAQARKAKEEELQALKGELIGVEEQQTDLTEANLGHILSVADKLEELQTKIHHLKQLIQAKSDELVRQNNDTDTIGDVKDVAARIQNETNPEKRREYHEKLYQKIRSLASDIIVFPAGSAALIPKWKEAGGDIAYMDALEKLRSDPQVGATANRLIADAEDLYAAAEDDEQIPGANARFFLVMIKSDRRNQERIVVYPNPDNPKEAAWGRGDARGRLFEFHEGETKD